MLAVWVRWDDGVPAGIWVLPHAPLPDRTLVKKVVFPPAFGGFTLYS
jgi:hypothetical protein